MAGLDTLHQVDYQGKMPDAAQWAMLPTNAYANGAQRANVEQEQQNVLQSQQNSLATSGLAGAVSNAQNNPQGIATLAQGEQGVAQTQSAKGQVDQAEAMSKISQAHIDDTIDKFKKAMFDAQANPVAGTSTIKDPEVKAAVDAFVQAHPNVTPVDALNSIGDSLLTLKNQHAAEESRSKGAASIENTKTIVQGREDVADKRIAGNEKVANIRAEATVDAAKVRAEATQAAKTSGHALQVSYGSQVSKLSVAHSQEVSRAKQLATLDPAQGAAAEAAANDNFNKDKATIDAIYQDVVKTTPASSTKITPEQFNTKWGSLKSGETLEGPDGKTYTKR
jgi:hypothetical protein